MQRFKESDLKIFTSEVLKLKGVPQKDADIIADIIVMGDLTEVDTHGLKMLPGIVKNLEKGDFNPNPELKIEDKAPAVGVLDGQNGIGMLISYHAMKAAIEKAEKVGVGFIVACHTTHWARAAYYARMAAEAGCIGLCFTNTVPNFPVWGGTEAAVGNNPVGIGVPVESMPDFIFDFAMTVAAWGKVSKYAELGMKAPQGWGLDKNGNPTDDPKEILESRRALPMGGHKGSGLAIAAEFLTGGLAGLPIGKAMGMKHTDWGQSFLAIKIDTILPVDEFKSNTKGFLKSIKDGKPQEGFDEIRYPGERAHIACDNNRNIGVPLRDGIVDSLKELASRLNINFPEKLNA